MTDISKCNREDCPKKDKCYRYTCEADDHQSYSEFKGGEDCDGFWENKNYDNNNNNK